MLKALMIACLATTAIAMRPDYDLVRIGSAGVSYINLEGFLVPTYEPGTNVRTFVFRTSVEGDLVPTSELVNFRCKPLDDIYVAETAPSKAALICSGKAFQKNMVFIFTANGLTIDPSERNVNLQLEKGVLMNLNAVPDALLGATILGDRV